MNRLPRVSEMTPDASGWGYFLCTEREVRAKKNGEMLIFTLQDASGQITAKVLEDAERFKHEFEPGEFVRAEGRVTVYNGQQQLVVSTIRRVHLAQDRQHGFREDDCVLSAPRPLDEMWAELDAHLQAVTDPFLRVLLNRIVADHASELREWPAALQVHHAYRGGLLEHVVRMIGIGRFLARTYGASEDLVTAGVVLHDIGNLQELSYSGGVTSYTREGNLVGHIGLGLILVREAARGISGFPEDLRTHLEHLVLSHHGSKERGSPVEPKTLEAFILSAVDELDSRINQVERAVRDDPGNEEFTAWHRRLGRVLYKGM
jgi:3'-5' exoribonuclease